MGTNATSDNTGPFLIPIVLRQFLAKCTRNHPGKHTVREMPKAPAALCCTAREAGVQPWLASSYGPAATRAVGQAAAAPVQELAAHCSPAALVLLCPTGD